MSVSACPPSDSADFSGGGEGQGVDEGESKRDFVGGEVDSAVFLE